MASCYNSDADDATAPRVLLIMPSFQMLPSVHDTI